MRTPSVVVREGRVRVVGVEYLCTVFALLAVRPSHTTFSGSLRCSRSCSSSFRCDSFGDDDFGDDDGGATTLMLERLLSGNGVVHITVTVVRLCPVDSRTHVLSSSTDVGAVCCRCCHDVANPKSTKWAVTSEPLRERRMLVGFRSRW